MFKNVASVPEYKYLESLLSETVDPDEEEILEPDEEDDDDWNCPDCGMPYADCLCE